MESQPQIILFNNFINEARVGTWNECNKETNLFHVVISTEGGDYNSFCHAL